MEGVSFYPLVNIQCYTVATTFSSHRNDVAGAAIESENCSDPVNNYVYADNQVWWQADGEIYGGGTLQVLTNTAATYNIDDRCTGDEGCVYEDNSEQGGLSQQYCGNVVPN